VTGHFAACRAAGAQTKLGIDFRRVRTELLKLGAQFFDRIRFSLVNVRVNG
jgi:hypothetical protein